MKTFLRELKRTTPVAKSITFPDLVKFSVLALFEKQRQKCTEQLQEDVNEYA